MAVAFAKNTSALASRLGDVFVYNTVTSAWESVGINHGLKITSQGVATEPDTGGRTKTLSVDYTVEFVLKQTLDQDFENLQSLVENEYDYFFSDEKMTATQFNALHWDGAASTVAPTVVVDKTTRGTTVKGTLIKGCSTEASPSFNYAGEENMIECSVKGRLGTSSISNLGTYGLMIFSA